MNRKEKFNTNLKKTTWLSWNYRDWQTEQYLNEHKQTINPFSVLDTKKLNCRFEQIIQQ